MTATACEAASAAGHVMTKSDLCATNLEPRSSRANFMSSKGPAYFKPQIEEILPGISTTP